MRPDTSPSRLRSVIERLVEEADPRRRDRLLLAGALHATGATASALWRESAQRVWWRVGALGPELDLPTGAQVEMAADGSLPVLPLGCGLVIGGAGEHRCALALGGLAPGAGEDAEELLEPLLLLHDSLERDCGSDADRVLPPFAAEDALISPGRPRGVHRPQRGPANGELRALLSDIRESQERLAQEVLGAAERAREGEILEQRCQRAGDLLLGPETQVPPQEGPSGEPGGSIPKT